MEIKDQNALWNWMMDGNYPPIDKSQGVYTGKKEHRTALATLARPVKMRKWQGHGAIPEYIESELPAGTRVNAVMASRFGDVGITDDLTVIHGYHARIGCKEEDAVTLIDIAPSVTPIAVS